MGKLYTRKELDDAYNSLNEEQKEMINDHLKRSKKTEWLNLWAKKKGLVLTEEELKDEEKAMESLLEWVLLDFEDNLTVSKDCQCQCGKPLRYRYTVLHKSTGVIYKLGKVHFAEHTGLDPKTVTMISRGLEKIDLEKDEILRKVKEGWKIPFIIPGEIDIPKDIKKLLDVKLPLLDSHIRRLENLMAEKDNIVIKINCEEDKRAKNKVILSTDEYLEEFIGYEYRQGRFFDLYSKVKNSTINQLEACELLYLLKNKLEELKDENVNFKELLKVTTIALGKISKGNLRNNLVEIEFYLEMYVVGD